VTQFLFFILLFVCLQVDSIATRWPLSRHRGYCQKNVSFHFLEEVSPFSFLPLPRLTCVLHNNNKIVSYSCTFFLILLLLSITSCPFLNLGLGLLRLGSSGFLPDLPLGGPSLLNRRDAIRLAAVVLLVLYDLMA